MDTREAIRDEFMRIYVRERVDRITVKGLCAAVPVARTTFYAHYRNVDDVLAEVEDRLLAGLADVTERISGGDLPNMDFAAFLDSSRARTACGCRCLSTSSSTPRASSSLTPAGRAP